MHLKNCYEIDFCSVVYTNKPETYSESYQTFKMELLEKIGDSFQPPTI